MSKVKPAAKARLQQRLDCVSFGWSILPSLLSSSPCFLPYSGCLAELGQHQPSSGAEFCNICSPGYYALSPSRVNCSPCYAGTFSNGLQGSCTACPQGTYSDVNLASGCAPCAAGFTPFKDGVAVSAGADGCRGVSW